MPVAHSVAAPRKSAYARSRTFRFGVWALAAATALIAWHAIQDSLIAKRENLRTVEGTVVEHRSTDWFRSPRAGWKGQPIRVQHDSLGHLYEIVVAGEVIRDVETCWRNRKIDNKSNTGLWIFLLMIGIPLTLVGYLLSLRHPVGPPPLP